MSSRKIYLVVFVLLFLTAGPSHTSAESSTPEDIVRQMVAAFNSHDVDAMLALCDPEIIWLSVSDDYHVSIETAGSEATRTELNAYFAAQQTVHSEIEDMIVNGAFVTTVERVSWTESREAHSQASIAVFEVINSKIRRAWYFPEQP